MLFEKCPHGPKIRGKDLLAILKKESQSNDTSLHFVEFSNVHNSDRSSNATQSKLVCKNV